MEEEAIPVPDAFIQVDIGKVLQQHQQDNHHHHHHHEEEEEKDREGMRGSSMIG